MTEELEKACNEAEEALQKALDSLRGHMGTVQC